MVHKGRTFVLFYPKKYDVIHNNIQQTLSCVINFSVETHEICFWISYILSNIKLVIQSTNLNKKFHDDLCPTTSD